MKKVLAVLVLFAGFSVFAYARGWADPILGRSSAQAASSTAGSEETGEVKSLIESKNYSAAADALSKKIASSTQPSSDDLLLLAFCHEKAGNRKAEEETCNAILRSHADAPAAAVALFRLGAIARDRGDKEAAQAQFTAAVSRFPVTEHGSRSAAELGRMCVETGDLQGARRNYSKVMEGELDDERVKAAAALSKMNDDIVRSQTPCDDVIVHQVQPGDALARIARKYNTAVGLIQTVNKLSGSVIHPGQYLKILKGDVTILIVKSRFRLSVFVGGIWFRDYEVGIGKNDSTPEGSFEITTKIENPPWHWQGRVIPPEDQENILGTRWMGFKNKPGLSGYGIHGTRDPSSVPGAVSSGCIRMRNGDVESLFELVPHGAVVTIRG